MGDRPKGKAQVNNGRPAEQGIWWAEPYSQQYKSGQTAINKPNNR